MAEIILKATTRPPQGTHFCQGRIVELVDHAFGDDRNEVLSSFAAERDAHLLRLRLDDRGERLTGPGIGAPVHRSK